MDHYKIQRDIETGKVQNVYLLMGEESYFIDEVTNSLENNILDEAEKSFNLTVVYGGDTTLDKILATAKGFPMMGDKQVVIVREAQELKEWKKSTELGQLIHYLENPQPLTVLVFAFKNKKLNKKLKAWKAFQKNAVVLESAQLKEYKIPEWIDGFVTQRGYKIDRSTCQLLAEYLGTNLSKLVNELNKLMIIIPDNQLITNKDVQENIGISKDYNVFELQKALGEKNIIKSNRIINYFDANPKSNPIQMVLPMLYSYFSRMLCYKAQQSGGVSGTPVGMSPWQAKEMAKVSANFKLSKLERIIGYIRETDKRSKGVNNQSIEDGFLMKELVFKILHY